MTTRKSLYSILATLVLGVFVFITLTAQGVIFGEGALPNSVDDTTATQPVVIPYGNEIESVDLENVDRSDENIELESSDNTTFIVLENAEIPGLQNNGESEHSTTLIKDDADDQLLVETPVIETPQYLSKQQIETQIYFWIDEFGCDNIPVVRAYSDEEKITAGGTTAWLALYDHTSNSIVYDYELVKDDSIDKVHNIAAHEVFHSCGRDGVFHNHLAIVDRDDSQLWVTYGLGQMYYEVDGTWTQESKIEEAAAELVANNHSGYTFLTVNSHYADILRQDLIDGDVSLAQLEEYQKNSDIIGLVADVRNVPRSSIDSAAYYDYMSKYFIN